MTKYLSMEREYIPWEAALRSLSSLFDVFDRNEVYGPMQVGSIKMMNKKSEIKIPFYSMQRHIFGPIRPICENKSSLCLIILLLQLQIGRWCLQATLISKDII